jgi:hypothetical protein
MSCECSFCFNLSDEIPWAVFDLTEAESRRDLYCPDSAENHRKSMRSTDYTHEIRLKSVFSHIYYPRRKLHLVTAQALWWA